MQTLINLNVSICKLVFQQISVAEILFSVCQKYDAEVHGRGYYKLCVRNTTEVLDGGTMTRRDTAEGQHLFHINRLRKKTS